LPEHLLQLDRIGVVQLEEKANDMFAVGNIGLVGNEWDTGVAGLRPVPMTFTISSPAGTSE